MTALNAKEGFLFGCDPELFVLDDKGRHVSAAPYIPGTKAQPFKVNKGAVQVDGVAAEFNIDPVSNYRDWEENIKTVMKELQGFLPKGYKLDCVPAVEFDADLWETFSDVSKELGCTPDFNAWTGDVNPPPHDPDNPRMRTASGHIHIGWTNDEDLTDFDHISNCHDFVKQLDWYLGAWSCRADTDNRRRRLYGKAGACRIKPYGVEYRVLSNFWIANPSRRLATWNRVQKAIEDMRKNYLPNKAGVGGNQTLINSINSTSISGIISRNYKYPVHTIETGSYGAPTTGALGLGQ